MEFVPPPIKGLGVFIFFLRCTLHILRKGDYDLIHIHKTDVAFFLPLLQKKYPVIITSHALPYMNNKWSIIGKAYFKLCEKVFISSKAFRTSISQPQIDYYFKKYQEKVYFIPNGVEPAPDPIPDIYKQRASEMLRHHSVEGKYILFAARRIVPLKGCHTLIDALTNIGYEGTLVIAGDSQQLPSYTKELKKAGQSINMKFMGYVEEKFMLFSLIKNAELFIFPSELEGMSMMLLEVGSVGTPMVCSDIPQNTAVFNDQEVLYFKNKDSIDLRNKMLYAFNNPEKMNEMASQAQDKVINDFSIKSSSQRYAELYNKLMGVESIISI